MGRVIIIVGALFAIAGPRAAAAQTQAGPPSPGSASGALPAPPSPRAPSKHRMRPAEVSALEQMIATAQPGDPDLPALLFRLADHYDRTADYLAERADRALTAGNSTRANKDRQAGEQAQQRALALYGRLASEPAFRSYARMDEVLFLLGQLLERRSEMRKARRIYLQLVKSYPQSRYIPNVYLSFADYYFDQGQLGHAEKFYDKVLQFPKAPVRAYAMFKKGWVYLNLNKSIEAMESFYKTHQLAKRAPLRRGARDGFVRAYAAVGRPTVAYRAFQRLSKSDADAMHRQLAQLYLDQGKADKAVFTYRALIARNPSAPEVCAWQGQVVEAMAILGDASKLQAERAALRKLAARLKTASCDDVARALAP